MEEFKKFENTVGQLVDVGLLATSLIILQDWISVGLHDPASFVSLIAIAVSTPMLVFDLLMQHMPERHAPNQITRFFGEASSWIGMIIASIGVASAIWHISWIAGIIFSFIGIFCYIVYGFSYTATETALKNEEQQKPPDQTITE